MNQITLIGASGLVGSSIKKELERLNCKYLEYGRNDFAKLMQDSHDHIIYAAGENICDMEHIANSIEANASLLGKIISKQNFNHLTYFSSTRLYLNSKTTKEDEPITLDSDDPRLLFNASKILGESICKLSKKPVCVVRPSNIYGMTKTSQLFLPSITRDAITKKIVNMYVQPDYSKDYISVQDVVSAALELSRLKYNGIVNLASGINTTAGEIAFELEKLTKCEIKWHKSGADQIFDPIDINKLKKIIPTFKAAAIKKDIEKLVDSFKKNL